MMAMGNADSNKRKLVVLCETLFARSKPYEDGMRTHILIDQRIPRLSRGSHITRSDDVIVVNA